MPPNEELARYINLKLAALGQPLCHHTADLEFLRTAGPLLRRLHQKEKLLGSRLSPVDARVQAFLDAYLTDVLTRLVNNHLQSRLGELTPWAWKAANP